MKTQNVKSNMLLRIFMILVASLMISPGVFAQKSFRNNDVKSLTASLFKSSEEIVMAVKGSAEKKAFYEEEVHFEDWMKDLDSWIKKIDSTSSEMDNEFKNSEMESSMEAIDNNLELENWMMDIHWIEKENFEEEALNLEAWMENPKNW